MKHTKRYQRCLNALCDLMCHAWLRKLFVSELIEKDGGSRFSFLFQRKSYATIKMWRWGTVVKVFAWLFGIEIPFRRFWSKAKWLEAKKNAASREGEQADESFSRVELDLDALDECLKSWFWLYGHMLQDMEDVLTQLRGWAEDCPCHGWLVARRDVSGPGKQPEPPTPHVRHSRFSRLTDSDVEDCPARGCRASEFAAGDALDVFDDLASLTEVQVTQKSSDVLLGDDLKMILEDFSGGVAFMRLELFEKLKFWQLLPWLFAGLLHPCLAKASQVASKVLQLMATFPDTPSLPRLARKWKAPEYIEQLQALSNASRPRTDLLLLCNEAARYFWIPTTERPIERPHAVANQDCAGKTKTYPVTISFSNRMPEIQTRLKKSPDFLNLLSDSFMKTRLNSHAIARALRIQHFPEVAESIDSRGRGAYPPASFKSKWKGL